MSMRHINATAEMISGLYIKNFRGFSEHFLPLGPLTVIVGENNAGKTTVVEALRLVSIITLRYKNLSFNYPPSNTEIPRAFVGISPSAKNLQINFNALFHRYSGPPAIIGANFVNGTSIEIYVLGGGKLHAVIKDAAGKIVKDRQTAKRIDLPSVSILPQVAPLQRQEKILSEDYVRGAMSSRLAPLHFRNQLKVMANFFPEFKSVVEDTWPGVQVRELIWQSDFPGEDLYLEIRNENFVAEVAEMGHGLQMWLQTMWFLTLAKNASTVILDEPDVYMHADLQRRIIRFLKNRYEQMIVTTHSVEIMSEVQPDEILVVDKNRSESSFAGSIPAVQRVLKDLGSIHNLHLARLLHAKKMIIVEGQDLKILRIFQDKLFPNSTTPFQGVPNMSIGGWGGWKFAIGGSMVFCNAFGENIKCYCVLDSDYHTDSEIKKRYDEASRQGVQLHIWQKKEIENYLLLPDVIARFIKGRAKEQISQLDSSEIQKQIEVFSDELEDDILDALSDELLRENRKKGVSWANKMARSCMNRVRKVEGNVVRLASGKLLFNKLSQWSKNEFGISFSVYNVALEMTSLEIPREVADVVNAIENGFDLGERVA